MTKDTEPTVDSGGAVPEPTGTPSTGTTGTPSPVDQLLKEALQRIDRLQGQVSALQSEKDKGIAKTRKEVSQLSEKFARYEELRSQRNMTPTEAQERLELEDMLAEYRMSKDQAPVARQEVDYADTLDLLGLDGNDPEVLKVTLLEDDPVRVKSKLIDLAAQKKRPVQPQAAPVPSAPLPTGGGSSTKPNLDAEYEKAKQNIRPGDVDAAFLLKRSFRDRAKKEGVEFSY